MMRDLVTNLVQKAASAAVEKAAHVGNAIETSASAAAAAVNLTKVGSLISLYAGHASLGKATIRDPKKRLEFYTHNVGHYSRRALEAMNFEIEVIGRDPELMKEKNFLMVGNHMSYLDILVLSSVQPSVFVTSVDMGEVFFLGTMAELGGSIFIERRHRGQIGQDLRVMANALRDGFNVMIYPEGTSTNGLQVQPFKKALLMSAVEAGRDILPVVTKYVEIDGEPFGPGNCDKVCWYGDMSFGPHFVNLMKLKKVKVEVHFLKPIKVTPETERKELAAQVYAAVSECYMSDKPWALATAETAKVEAPASAAEPSPNESHSNPA